MKKQIIKLKSIKDILIKIKKSRGKLLHEKTNKKKFVKKLGKKC